MKIVLGGMSISGMPMAGERDDLENLSLSGLVSLVRQLLERREALERENAALKAENAALRADNTALKAEKGFE